MKVSTAVTGSSWDTLVLGEGGAQDPGRLARPGLCFGVGGWQVRHLAA